MKKIVVNGKFMSQSVTGVQRYAREILNELDKITDGYDIYLAVDSNAENVPEYKNIEIQQVGRLKGNLWEQISLPLYVKREKAICLNLCNMMPVLTPDLVVVHDIAFKVKPQFFSNKFVIWYKTVYALSIARAKQIITVSEFSKGEILRNYKIPEERVSVISSAWQHFERIEYDENALTKYGLKEQSYFFAMSSMTVNKNFKWIIRVAVENPNETFAVSGSINRKVFGNAFDYAVPDNLKFLGYVSDSEAKTLMRGCKAFLFPTYYEGFGLPPMEALSIGAKIIVSDRSCMPEVYGDSAYYIDPSQAEIDLNALLSEGQKDGTTVLEKYSWEKSARRLKNLLDKTNES